MVDEVVELPEQVRGRPFPKGRSGNPAGRRFGSRNKATMAALELLADEAEALTRKAVEAALAGDPTAIRLCLQRILPPERRRCRPGDGGGHRGARRRPHHAGRSSSHRQGGHDLRANHRDQ